MKERKYLNSVSGRSEVLIPPELGNLDWFASYTEHRLTSSNLPQGVQSVNDPPSNLASNSSVMGRWVQHEDTEGNEINPMNSGQDQFANCGCNQMNQKTYVLSHQKEKMVTLSQRIIMTQPLKMNVKAAKSNRRNASFGGKR